MELNTFESSYEIKESRVLIGIEVCGLIGMRIDVVNFSLVKDSLQLLAINVTD